MMSDVGNALATASFFGNRSSLEVYVGGDSSNLNTFSGNIYSISFANDKQSLSVDEAFNSWGVPLDYENFFAEFSLETGLGEFDFDAGTRSNKKTRYERGRGNFKKTKKARFA